MSEAGTDTDMALIAAYRRGDDQALHTLVERHQDQIYRLALGLLGSPQDAEDATQEVLMAVLTALPRFRGESRFSTWLYRLTLNTCVKRRRQQSRRREEPLPESLPAVRERRVACPDVLAGRAWLRARVAEFLAALPESYRLSVVLSDALDLPVTEIAALLGLSLPAVKARLRRGRQRLRAMIEQYCQEAGFSSWQELLDE